MQQSAITQSHSNSRRIPVILLATGALAGVLIASLGLLQSNEFSLDQGVAQVNHALIPVHHYQRLLSALQADKRSPLTDEDRKKLLDQLVDEELLIQRGVELGFLELNSTVRNTLSQAVTNSFVAGNDVTRPTEQQLASFYAENANLFIRPPRLHLAQIYISNTDGSATTKTETVVTALNNGAGFTEVKEQYGDSVNFEIPDVLLPPQKLQQYIGPTLLAVASKMSIGEVSAPIELQGNVHILQLVNHVEAELPDLVNVRRQVETEYLRRRTEQEFNQYIQWLRDRADITEADVTSADFSAMDQQP